MPNKNPKIYAFIDSQNLNLGVRSQGYRIDFKRFRLYLKNKYNVTQAFIFIGLVDGNQELYKNLQQAGFILIMKPTVRYYENGKETVKGNVDTELVLHSAAIEYDNYDKAIIISGDGDFYCLIEYLEKNNKLLRIFTPNKNFSKLLRKYSKYIVVISELKNSFLFQPKTPKNQKAGIGGRSKP